MEQESSQPTFLSHILKWGLICGSISILMIVLLYVIDYTMMVQLKFLLVALLISLAAVIYAGIDYRNSVGGFLSYGKAWQHGMAVLAISGVVYVLFNILLHYVIDTELSAKLVDATMENTREMMEGFGAPDDQIEKALDDARSRTENQFKLSGMAMGYGFSLIFYAILASISSIFVKKTVPVENM